MLPQHEPLRLTEEEEIQICLETLTMMSRRYDRVEKLLDKVGDAYNKATEWLLNHGVWPEYDHEKRCYIAEPIPNFVKTP